MKLSEAFLCDEGREHIESLPKWWTTARIPNESSDPAPDQPEGKTTGRIPWVHGEVMMRSLCEQLIMSILREILISLKIMMINDN